uniref:LSDAT_euk domain-containing protein n=1 Tax=Macrostomum lignano TaxID=282301 RepID=A0A1I8IVR7_9PLAT
YLDSLVVTDGLSKGIVKLAGKAVRDYNDAYGQDRISLLAVLPWKWVPSRSELVSKDFAGLSNQPPPAVPGSLPGLDPNHNFFLMVDDNAETDTVVEVRTRIETLLSRLDESMPQAPACCILANGTLDDVASLHRFVELHIELHIR